MRREFRVSYEISRYSLAFIQAGAYLLVSPSGPLLNDNLIILAAVVRLELRLEL